MKTFLSNCWAESYQNNCRNYIVIVIIKFQFETLKAQQLLSKLSTPTWISVTTKRWDLSLMKIVPVNCDNMICNSIWDLEKNLWLAIICYLYCTSFKLNCKIGLLLMPGTVLMLTNCRETVMCLRVCTLNLSLDKTIQVPKYSSSSSFDALR